MSAGAENREPPLVVVPRAGPNNQYKSEIIEEDLDLTVDFDSEVEDNLYPDDPPQRLDQCIWPPEDKLKIRQQLAINGLEWWLKTYAVNKPENVPALLELFDVTLPERIQRLSGFFKLPLLKAAAFRFLRERDPSLYPPQLSSSSNGFDMAVSLIENADNIVVITGAGISTSCGIPDFRSRNGLYAQLASSGIYDIDDPQEMFDINYFKRNPRVFYSFAHKIYPSRFKPSSCHRFISALEKEGQLLRNYTQNIDSLEKKAGINRIVQCHGSFDTATCVKCLVKVPGETIKDDLLAQRVPLCKRCNPRLIAFLASKKKVRRKKKKKRNDGWESDESEEPVTPLPDGIMKPDITFFGEKLSGRFDKKVFEDVALVDLVLVIGTSLKVRPVSEIISHFPHNVVPIVINKTPLPHIKPGIQLLGDADVIVECLARKLGLSLEPDHVVQEPLPSLDTARLFARPSRSTYKRKQSATTTYQVIKNTGVVLFEGAEGGEFVNALIAKNETINIVERTESESDDERDDEGPLAKKAREVL